MYDDARPFVWIGISLFLLGVSFLIVMLTSQNSWEWMNATAVRGTEQGGLVYYSYRGANYTVYDPTSNSPVPRARTVYLDPSNPSNSVLSITVTQVSDSLFVAGPFIASAAFFTAALARRKKRSRIRAEHPDGDWGFGLPRAVVAQAFVQQQADAQKRRGPPGG